MKRPALSPDHKRVLAIAAWAPTFGLLILREEKIVSPELFDMLIGPAIALFVPGAFAFVYLHVRYPPPPRRIDPSFEQVATLGITEAARLLDVSIDQGIGHGRVRGVPIAFGTTLFNRIWIEVWQGHPLKPVRRWTRIDATSARAGKAIADEVERRVGALTSEAESALAALRAAPSVFDRRDAIRRLATVLRTTQVLEELERAACDDDIRIRLPAALALDRMGAIRASDVPALLDITIGVDLRGRLDACAVLGRIGDAEILSALVERKNRGDGDSDALADAIAKIGARVRVSPGELSMAALPHSAGNLSESKTKTRE